MAVGKGSLKRVGLEKKSEIITLTPNNVVEILVDGVVCKNVTDNKKTEESVKKYGVILPIIVEETAEGLKVVDGAKRVCALKTLGVKTAKAVVISDGKGISAELKKFEKQLKTSEKKEKSIHEEKFDMVKRLGEEEMPVYLL